MKIIFKLLKYLALALVLTISVLLLSIPLSIWERPSDLLAVDNSMPLLLDNARIVDVETGVVESNKQIRIEEGQIAAILAAGVSHDDNVDYRRIDLDGAYLLPGLFDMHVHLHDRKYLALNLAYGVTHVRNLRGLPMHLRWKRELRNDEWLGSNLISSSPVFDGPQYAHVLQQVVTDPKEAERLVERYHQRGYDLIKAYGYLDARVFTAIVNKAKELDMPIAKHAPHAVKDLPLDSIQGLQSLEHVEDIFQGPLNFEFDAGRLKDWVAELALIKPTVTPTLATFDHLTEISLRKQAFIDELPLETLNPLYRLLLKKFSVDRWLEADEEHAKWNAEERLLLFEIVRALDDQGIPLLVGSDAGTNYMPAGSSTHREMELLVQAGLTPAKVLTAATINAAKALGIDESYGTIEVGKIADIVVLDESPLTNIGVARKPVAVIKNGQWLAKDELRALRDSAANPSGYYISLGRLLEDVLGRWLIHK